MLFNSLPFFIFLPVTLLLYWSAARAETRQTILLTSSLVFYAFWFPPHILLLLALVTVCWFSALYLAPRGPTLAISSAALILFAALGYWKYASFLARVLRDLGMPVSWLQSFPEQMTLPLGISFIVFQGLGYVIDVARRDKEPEPHWSTVVLFKAYFPQLIAGPICRAQELMPQLKALKAFNARQFASGWAILGIGLFLKVVFADNVAPTVDGYFAIPDQISGAQAWGAALGFAVQILGDFWGYSTMAYGMSLMFGIVLPVNFRLPYLALGVRDFWRRWHITLSFWLRDYLYKPLGGSHHGLVKTFGALLLTMLLGGIWHGANYTFLIWGLWHGLALILEHAMVRLFGQMPLHSRIISSWAWGTVSSAAAWLYAMSVVLIGWVFFRADTVGAALSVLSHMHQSLPTIHELPRGFVILILGFFLIQKPVECLLDSLRAGAISSGWCYLMTVWLLLAAVIMSADDALPFIYFQF